MRMQPKKSKETAARPHRAPSTSGLANKPAVVLKKKRDAVGKKLVQQ